MKKIFFIISILIYGSSFSQVSYGIKAGYNLSSMKMKGQNQNENFDSKSFFYLGGFLNHKMTDQVSLQAELQFTEIGGSTKVEYYKLVGNEVVYEGMANYRFIIPQVTVPLSVKYYPDSHFALLAGLNTNFIISPKVKTNFIIDGVENNNIGFLKSVSFNPFVGAEYKLNEKFFTEARYNFGIFNMAKSGAVDTHIGYFQIGFGYTFY